MAWVGIGVALLIAFSLGSLSRNKTSDAQTQNMQFTCADESRKYFADFMKKYGDPATNYSTQNHWNTSIKKCFISIARGKFSPSTGDSQNGQLIIDVAEDDNYGQATFLNNAERPGQLYDCQVSHDGVSEMQPCSSLDEFQKYVKLLMTK